MARHVSSCHNCEIFTPKREISVNKCNKTKYVMQLCDLTCAKISGILPWFSF